MNNKDMKELIKEYQTGTSTQVIERILSYIDEDLTGYKYDEGDETSEKVDPIIYISYRIRALLMKDCFKERNQRHIYEQSDEDKKDYQDFFGEEGSWIVELYENQWLGVDIDEIQKYNFKSVWNNRTKIKKYYGGKAHELFYLCKKFRGRSQNSWEFEEDFQRTKDKLLPFFVKALEHALSKVDANREEKEIVKYINIALQTKLIELQMEEAGTKRIVKGNSSMYITPKFDDDTVTQAWMVMLGNSLKFVGVGAFDEYLTKSQNQFMIRLHAIIVEEIKNENVDAFWWGEDSKPRLNKKYLSGLVEMKEDNLRKTLKRISDKINVNWKEIWTKYRNVG